MQTFVKPDEPPPLTAERPSVGTGMGTSLRQQFLPSGQCWTCTWPKWASLNLGFSSDTSLLGCRIFLRMVNICGDQAGGLCPESGSLSIHSLLMGQPSYQHF